MRSVVRTAYSGRWMGSRLTSTALGVIGAKVPRATSVTPTRAPNTHRMATASHTLGKRRPVASAGWIVAGILLRRGGWAGVWRPVARPGFACHAWGMWRLRDGAAHGRHAGANVSAAWY